MIKKVVWFSGMKLDKTTSIKSFKCTCMPHQSTLSMEHILIWNCTCSTGQRSMALLLWLRFTSTWLKGEMSKIHSLILGSSISTTQSCPWYLSRTWFAMCPSTPFSTIKVRILLLPATRILTGFFSPSRNQYQSTSYKPLTTTGRTIHSLLEATATTETFSLSITDSFTIRQPKQLFTRLLCSLSLFCLE